MYGPRSTVDSSAANPAIFGDGSDGDLALTGFLSLTRDMSYRNVKISGSGSLQLNGWILRVSDTLDLSAATNVGSIYSRAGTFTNNGLNTGNPGAANVGGAAQGNTVSQGSIPQTVGVATAGATGTTGVGANPTAVTGATWSPSVITNLAGAAGGAGGSGAGGAGLAQNVSPDRVHFRNGPLQSLNANANLLLGTDTVNTWMGMQSGISGSSGAGDGTVAGGGGGAAGNAQSAMFIFANKILRGASTVAGAINAMGMKGGAGGTPVGGNCGGGGGGAGSSAALVWIITTTLLGAPAVNCIDVSGSNGGKGGDGTGTGIGGTGGPGGCPGMVAFRLIGSPTVITAPATPGTLGGAGVGNVGGAGGIGAVLQVTL